jgi:hypothetical protein
MRSTDRSFLLLRQIFERRAKPVLRPNSWRVDGAWLRPTCHLWPAGLREQFLVVTETRAGIMRAARFLFGNSVSHSPQSILMRRWGARYRFLAFCPQVFPGFRGQKSPVAPPWSLHRRGTEAPPTGVREQEPGNLPSPTLPLSSAPLLLPVPNPYSLFPDPRPLIATALSC